MLSQNTVHFYNTIKLRGANLKEAIKKADSQEQKVMAMIKYLSDYRPKYYTIQEIKIHWLRCYKKPINIHSLKRAVTNLTSAGILIKSEVTFKGPEGKPVHGWAWAVN